MKVNMGLLGVLLWDLCDARSPSLLSLGTGVLTGPGRIPAFHWEVWESLFMESLLVGCACKLCAAHCGLLWFCFPVALRSKDKNIWENKQIKALIPLIFLIKYSAYVIEYNMSVFFAQQHSAFFASVQHISMILHIKSVQYA